MTLDTSPKTYGEPSIEAVASGLGTLGRYGDNYMVHAAEGETIVPREVLEQNPGLKEDLFRQMTMMGIENPNRYVVGDQLNSINPITGQPEFFFKKIFRAIKKVVKKAAPIIVPMLGNMILPGIGGLLASGLYTKAQGGSWGDALKAAGMAYLGNVASAGIMGGINAPSGQFFDGFSTGIGQGIRAPFDAVSGLIQGGSASPFQQGIFASDPAGAAAPGVSLKDKILRQYDPQYLDQATKPVPAVGSVGRGSSPIDASTDSGLINVKSTQAMPGFDKDPISFARQQANLGDPRYTLDSMGRPYYDGKLIPAKIPDVQTAATPRPLGPEEYTMTGRPRGPEEYTMTAPARDLAELNYVPDAYDYGKAGSGDYSPGYSGDPLSPQNFEATTGMPYKGSIEQRAAGDAAINDRGYLGKYVLDPIDRTLTPLVGEELAKKASPYIAGAGALGLAGYATGAFDDDPPPPPNATQRQMEAYDAYLAAKASRKLTTKEHLTMRAAAGIAPQYSRSQLARIIGRDVSSLPDYYFTAAGGGEVMGPGTGTSDSIPARLSDGEFVMTARAVRNAGGGDRSLGAARMYDMMNRFEQGAA